MAGLVLAVQGGDERALDSILRKLQGPLLGLASRILRDPIAAEDVFVEVMARLLPRARDFEEPDRFAAYARRAVRNASVDTMRRRSDRDARQALVDTDRLRWGEEEGSEDDAPVERFASSSSSPEQAAIEAERRRTVVAGVESLGEPGRTVVRLFYEDDMTYDEIGEQIGVSPATVKRHLASARFTLAARLRNTGEAFHAHE